MPPQIDVLVIGAGFSGTMAAANLVKGGFPGSIMLLERTESHARGVAYRPPSDLLLLNVPAKNMGAWADAPGDFHAWLTATNQAFEPSAFVSRRVYGDYLHHLLEQSVQVSGGRLRVERGEAVSAIRDQEHLTWRVQLASGEVVRAGRLVLALGNLRPGPPPGLTVTPGARWWRPDPWSSSAHTRCADGERVLVIGSGLTMADVCISLTVGGARPRITVISRNGLLPCVHSPAGLKPIPAAPPRAGASLREIVRHVRREAKRIGHEGGDWRAAIDVLRSITPAVWGGFTHAERVRFLQRLRTYWDIHRHRVPAEVLGRLVELWQRGDLRVYNGRLRGSTDQGERVEVSWSSRGDPRVHKGVFDRVINCTGARTSPDASPLLASLSDAGELRAEEIGLGVLTDPEGRAIDHTGVPRDDLWVIGPLRRGTLWESTAVPELRHQAAGVARGILAQTPPR